MAEEPNYRGYAFTALRISWERQLHWDIFAAANRYGYYPTLYEWIKERLRTFDSLWLAVDEPSIDEAQAIMRDLIIDQGKAITDGTKGHFEFLKPEGEPQYVQAKYDTTLNQPIVLNDASDTITIGDRLPYIEPGYKEVEDNDLMRYRMRLIAQRLTPLDLKNLTAYIDGEYDSIEAIFNNVNKATMFRRRIRRACKSLDGSVVFG